MSGLIVEFNGRGFWDKHNHDIWYYHLSYLIKQSDNMPQWSIQWADKWLELAPQMLPGYMFMSALEILTDDNRISLIVELSNNLLKRFENYDEFLELEKQRWLATGKPLKLKGIELARKIIADPRIITMHTHWDMVDEVTQKFMSSLPTFGKLFIRLLTGENWKRAYFNSYAEPILVTTIDRLSDWIPDGEIGLSRVPDVSRMRNHIFPYWINADNENARIEDLYGGGYGVCRGVPDLLLVFGKIEDETEYDAMEFQFSIEDGLREQWILDFDKNITLLLSAENNGFTQRCKADADFYSPALQRKVNLKAIYQARN